MSYCRQKTCLCVHIVNYVYFPFFAEPKSRKGSDSLCPIWSTTWRCNWSLDTSAHGHRHTHPHKHRHTHIHSLICLLSHLLILFSMPLNPSECISQRTKTVYFGWSWWVNYTTGSMIRKLWWISWILYVASLCPPTLPFERVPPTDHMHCTICVGSVSDVNQPLGTLKQMKKSYDTYLIYEALKYYILKCMTHDICHYVKIKCFILTWFHTIT